MKSKVPGKLFIAGEFSILSKESTAILVSVSKFIYVDITENSNYEFESELGHFRWILDEDKIPVLDYKDFKHVKAAIFMAHKYLNHLKIEPKTYNIKLNSELEEQGNKYGLGSSAASLVGVLRAILNLHQVRPTKLELFKLAVMTQLEINDLSSGADLATVIYTGWVYYKKYDLAWLYQKDKSAFELIEEEWPSLKIEILPVINYRVLVGWTKKASSSSDTIQKLESRNLNDSWYKDFLAKANKIVLAFKKELLIDNNTDKIYQLTEDYQNLLNELENWSEIKIMTPELTMLNKISKNSNLVSKVSGSGGGDCGICVVQNNFSHIIEEKIAKNWQNSDIKPLKLEVWSDKNERN
ncbi:Phosphomevalonate kinase [Alteracholeplasma palmae J233]|uniref:phosphomevalonate kinase n=1 Tax=Alteracholeplasma palmae (strain ATCC 49389 / J233) TaxID=1318466 RepID=U4KL71_ALTPJ|nr:phosphomevalonate kinase [Alteracholeplasma palmae]CCV64522.1 Phosphomevalonate kinase [Alteracholeplasma palmae J233]